jgi:hypothetical protein
MIGDTYDEYGNLIPGASASADPAATSTATTDTRKADIVAGIIIPGYQNLLGRAPNAQEIEEAYALYEAKGGDAFRASLAERQDKPKQFTWSDYGAPPSGFGEEYSAGTFTPPQFTEKFAAPTVEDMLKDPGYRARMDESQRGVERSAAAKGSILSGGFVGRTLPRVLQEQASNEYSNTFKRAFDTYQQRYGQFSDAAGREANAFAMNETGKLNQFQTRYKSYADVVANKRLSEEDRWQREMDLARLGLGAVGG